MMDSQDMFNIVVSFAGFMGGWVLNNIYKTMERLDRDVRQMPLMYVTQSTYRADIDEIKGMLTRIHDKLDHKVDK
jgi:hypothetical protein